MLEVCWRCAAADASKGTLQGSAGRPDLLLAGAASDCPTRSLWNTFVSWGSHKKGLAWRHTSKQVLTRVCRCVIMTFCRAYLLREYCPHLQFVIPTPPVHLWPRCRRYQRLARPQWGGQRPPQRKYTKRVVKPVPGRHLPQSCTTRGKRGTWKCGSRDVPTCHACHETTSTEPSNAQAALEVGAWAQ